MRLDGLKIAGTFAWPGAVHEGHGEAQVVIDDRATPAQREAIMKIVSGQETEPFATFFSRLFGAMIEKFHEPLFKPIEFEIDLEEKRIGRFSVAGFVECTAEPIRNPVTGNKHRARVMLAARLRISRGRIRQRHRPKRPAR